MDTDVIVHTPNKMDSEVIVHVYERWRDQSDMLVVLIMQGPHVNLCLF